MKIRDDNGLSRGIPASSRPVHATPTDRGERADTTQNLGDRVELSDQARALHVAQEALQQLPAVRTDKVKALQEQVQSGSYRVSGGDVAAHMLGDGYLI